MTMKRRVGETSRLRAITGSLGGVSKPKRGTLDVLTQVASMRVCNWTYRVFPCEAEVQADRAITSLYIVSSSALRLRPALDSGVMRILSVHLWW